MDFLVGDRRSVSAQKAESCLENFGSWSNSAPNLACKPHDPKHLVRKALKATNVLGLL
jgi:hypothetical protein